MKRAILAAAIVTAALVAAPSGAQTSGPCPSVGIGVPSKPRHSGKGIPSTQPVPSPIGRGVTP